MKKWIFLFLLHGCCTQIMAQSLNEIKGIFMMNDFKKAKTMIDGFLQNAKKPKNANNEEAWFLSAQIHNYYSFDSTISTVDALRLKGESFASLQQYLQLDSSMKVMSEENGKVIFLQLYSSLYNLGIGFFNNQVYDKAAEAFMKANDAKNLSMTHKLRFDEIEFSKLDTGLIINIGVSALNAKNEALAMSYFQQLADASLSGKDYLQYYVTLAEHYLDTKDTVRLSSISDKAQFLYPESADQFVDYEIKLYTDGLEESEKMVRLQKLIKKYPTNTYLKSQTLLSGYRSLWENDNAPAFTMADVTKADQLTASLDNAILQEDQKDPFVWQVMDRHLSKYLDALIEITNNRKNPESARKAKLTYERIFIVYIKNLEALDNIYSGIHSPTKEQNLIYKQYLGKLKIAYEEKKDKKKADEIGRKMNAL